jgi:hypothetical protein
LQEGCAGRVLSRSWLEDLLRVFPDRSGFLEGMIYSGNKEPVDMEYNEFWIEISEKRDQLTALTDSYWRQYSGPSAWQFWEIVILLVAPLILLYFKADRKRALELFFLGYTIHVLWTYIDGILEQRIFFVHTYLLVPYVLLGINMTASAIPVAYILVYQYCSNKKKSFYLYALLLTAFFAFIFAPLEHYVGLVKFNKGMNYFYLFLLGVGTAYVSYWFTKLILRFKGAH